MTRSAAASASAEREGRLYIDGEFREAASGRRFEVISPTDESVVATAADAGAEDVAAAVAAARRAADETTWSSNHEFRQQCLRQLQEALRKEIADICVLQTLEAGTPQQVTPTMEAVVGDMSHYIEMVGSFPWETDFPAFRFLVLDSLRRVRYEPYGVVGAITPWNGPFMPNMWKINGSLATGNTIVLKTAPDSPLTGAAIAKAAAEHTDIPPGVLNVISSADRATAGDALTADQRVDMYHFTGSPSVGQRIMERAAVGIRKVVLELGGKSANIVLDDANLDIAVGMGVGYCMANSGQGCTLATRMIVHSSIYDEVLARVEAMVAATPWGDPMDPVNTVGPIIRASQLDRVAGLVDRARDAGARVLAGGARGDREKGFWYLPTALADVDENSEIAQTEIFGPVLSIIRFEGSDDEAIRIANNSPYGLSSYVQTNDPERAWHVANKLKAGTVNVGLSFHLSPDTPFGGYGQSGLGREHGDDGFREYLQAKTISTPA